ncbi:Nuclear GTPase SLIP-GC [Colletotrichum higginsianum]|uniref:Nuclear GTPase SLIP-GC n=1 Tax=Colletotrichum higginsianum TaxID=80884 RepID=A0A4T0WG86_9PEZI|nr:Nuclear GTPase SLIP-GC [Colletotrichum higginsianum]
MLAPVHARTLTSRTASSIFHCSVSVRKDDDVVKSFAHSIVWQYAEFLFVPSTTTIVPIPGVVFVDTSTALSYPSLRIDAKFRPVNTSRQHLRVRRLATEHSGWPFSTGASSRLDNNARTPSFSFSPPPPSTPTQHRTVTSVVTSPNGTASPRSPDETESVAGRLGNMNLTPRQPSLAMSDVGAAIADVANGLDEQTPRPAASSPDFGRPSPSPSPSPHPRLKAKKLPHNVKDEKPPSNRFHDPTVQQAFGEAKTLMSSLANALGSSSLHVNPDSTIQRLHRQAQDLSRFQCPSTRTVGFVGDSGVGKSSLLNSLLDNQHLARTSNSGAACTCVVTEYHYHDSRDFVIDVELFSQEKLMDQITELLQTYRRHHLPSEENETAVGADVREVEDVGEVKDVEEQAKVAHDTFKAMFRDRLKDEQVLTTKPKDYVLSTLRSWVLEARPSQIGGIKTRSSLQECSDLLMHLTSETAEATEPAVWPYIRKIKVFLDSHILSKGLVLVDLPGLRDLNSARRMITERYLVECDEIFAVCNIGRAMTDVGVFSVFELAQKAKLSNVGIICTRSDDIQASEAVRDWTGSSAERVQKLSNNVSTVQSEISNIVLVLPDEDTGEDSDCYNKLFRDKHKAEKRLLQHQFKLKKYLIETRNTDIISKLQTQYGDAVPARTLQVFCVSNTEYWAKRSMPRDDALPSLELSCILDLRKHCLSIVADTQLEAAKQFVVNDIPALVGDVALWVQSGAGSTDAEHKRAVRETLDEVERRLKKDLAGRSSMLSKIAKSFVEDFKTHVYDNRNTDDWTQSAIAAGSKWNEWTHPVGRWHDWNEEIIAGMVTDLAVPWQRLCSSFGDEIEQAIDLVDESMEWALEFLEDELDGFSFTMTLSQVLLCHKNTMLAEAQKAYDNFENSLSTLRVDALSGIRTSLIGQAMESSYKACNLDSGGGSHERRKGYINGTIARQDLFRNLMRDFRRRLNGLADSLQADLLTTIRAHLAMIDETLDLIRRENVATESEGNPELRSRLGEEVSLATEKTRLIQQVIVG